MNSVRVSLQSVLTALVLLSAVACKKVEVLAFEPAGPLVINSDKGAEMPKVVGKTAKGEPVELKTAVAMLVAPVGVVEMQGGRLVPMKNGKTTINAAYEDAEAKLEVEVNIVDEVTLSCPTTPCALRVGEDVQLSSSVMGLGVAMKVDFTWTSSSDLVAKVASGKVSGVSPGKATITAEAAGKKATLDVEVRATVEELRLFCASPPMLVVAKAGNGNAIKDRSCDAAKGEKVKLLAEAVAAGKPLPDERLEWSSSDASVMVVQGELTPVASMGGSIVTVKLGGTSAEVPVAVQGKKKGAPPCDENDSKWGTEAAAEMKAKLGDAEWLESLTLRCQGSPSADCASAAVTAFAREAPTFGVDLESGKRLWSFFAQETAARCCCVKR